MSAPNRDLWIALGIFTILFSTGALLKGFHVDEFYSWFYTLNCSAAEILRMKDTGIGHPPLFHLLLKGLQTLFPEGPVQMMRLINLVAGLLTLGVLWKLLQENKAYQQWLFWGVAGSGAFLNGFMLSRMYGLACLGACLTILLGERLVRQSDWPTFFAFLSSIFFGFFADFNYFLLVPYIGLVLLRNSRLFKPLLFSCFTVVTVFWWLLHLGHAERRDKEGGPIWLVMTFFRYLYKLAFEVINSLLQFWFFEPLVIAILVIIGITWWELRKPDPTFLISPARKLALKLLASLIGLGLVSLLAEADVISGAFLAFMVLLPLGWSAWEVMRYQGIDLNSRNARLTLAIIGGLEILLMMNVVIWRTLLSARFLLVLLPIILLWFATFLPRRSLTAIGGTMLLSGLLFTFSAGIGEIYPPSPPAREPLVFHNTAAMANSVLLNGGHIGSSPFLVDFSHFQKSCRVCKMGNGEVPFADWPQFYAIGWESLAADTTITKQFELKQKEVLPGSNLDELFFRIWHPVHQRHFFLYDFERKPLME